MDRENRKRKGNTPQDRIYKEGFGWDFIDAAKEHKCYTCKKCHEDTYYKDQLVALGASYYACNAYPEGKPTTIGGNWERCEKYEEKTNKDSAINIRDEVARIKEKYK